MQRERGAELPAPGGRRVDHGGRAPRRVRGGTEDSTRAVRAREVPAEGRLLYSNLNHIFWNLNSEFKFVYVLVWNFYPDIKILKICKSNLNSDLTGTGTWADTSARLVCTMAHMSENSEPNMDTDFSHSNSPNSETREFA